MLDNKQEVVLPKNAVPELVSWMERNHADPDKIVQTFFKIKDKNGQIVNFRYNMAQRLHKERSSKFDMVLKARKLGISSKRIARDLAICSTRKMEYRVALTAPGPSRDIIMAERVKPLIQNCVYPLNAILRQDYIFFPLTGSRYYVGTAGSKKFGRGDDITGKHYMETAHWPNPDVMFGVDEALVENSDGMDESTANGHNFWKVKWENSKRGKNKDKAIFLPWYVSEDYVADPASEPGVLSEEEQAITKAFHLKAENIAWRRWKKRTMQEPSLFPQEYPETDEEAFLSTGRPVFDKLALAYCRQTCSEPKWVGYLIRSQENIKFVPDTSGNLKIWKMPEEGHIYAIGADVAEGIKDGANSVGDVIDIGDSEQVAEWVGHVSPDQFADKLHIISDFYKIATIIPESWPGPGEVTTSHLCEKGAKVWRPQEGDHFGFKTNSQTKQAMIARLNGALRDFSLTIRSPELLEELHAYIYNERMAMVPSLGSLSDRIIAIGIAYYCTRDIAERTDYYTPRRLTEVLGRYKARGAGVSAPHFTGPRIGVRET